MSAPTVVSTASLTFGSDTYKCKSLPAGRGQTCEPVDVTTLSDGKVQRCPGALKTNAEITAVIAGVNVPALNEEDELTITLGSSSVSVMAVCTSLVPATLEADNSREITWTATFKPTGASVPSAS